MTHTPEQLKELAEFAGEFLGMTELPWHGRVKGRFWWLGSEGKSGSHRVQLWGDNGFFEGDDAPILMNLAQEKLEKLGYEVEMKSYPSGAGLFWSWGFHKSHSLKVCEHKFKDNSTFIAFWLAIESAVKGEK